MSMSRLTHAICDECWIAQMPGREPMRLRPANIEDCCYCGVLTVSGIYVRDSPEETPCGGKHRE